MAEYENPWLVVVSYDDWSPDYDAQLASLAEELGGEYDGWGHSPKTGIRDIYLYFPTRFDALTFIAEAGDLPGTEIYEASLTLSPPLEDD